MMNNQTNANDIPHVNLSSTGPRQENQSVSAYTPPGILFLQKPGNLREHVDGPMRGAMEAGIRCLVCEVNDIWELRKSRRSATAKAIVDFLCRERVGAVFSYVNNAITAIVLDPQGQQGPRSIFEAMGIPVLCLWTDHPQWSPDGNALQVEHASLLSSSLHHHFVKNHAHARELEIFLGWLNCHALPVAQNPVEIVPWNNRKPACDIVFISQSVPPLPAALMPFLASDDPDPRLMREAIEPSLSLALEAVWKRHVPQSLLADFLDFGRQWLNAKIAEPRRAALDHFLRLCPFAGTVHEWLKENQLVYFEAARVLWGVREWERVFFPAWLARRFRVAVHGSDWSQFGIESHPAWVPQNEQAKVYATGRLALNITQANDEEGLSHKIFEMASAAVPVLHNTTLGLDECFDPAREVAIFDTPSEAAKAADWLLKNPLKARDMAEAAHARLLREHTWKHRFPVMLEKAGLDLRVFAGKTENIRKVSFYLDDHGNVVMM